MKIIVNENFCRISRCKGLDYLECEDLFNAMLNLLYSYPVHNEAVQKLQILHTACKRKATDTACERPSKVIRTVLSEQAESDISSWDV